MLGMLKISEAASIGMHAMALLAASQEKWLTARDIVGTLKVSEAHLLKVMQRLVKVGLVKSIRGPKGGFKTGRDADKIMLINIYEAIDGPMASNDCLFPSKICGGEKCVFGGLLTNMNKGVRDYFTGTRLSEAANVYNNKEGTK